MSVTFFFLDNDDIKCKVYYLLITKTYFIDLYSKCRIYSEMISYLLSLMSNYWFSKII